MIEKLDILSISRNGFSVLSIELSKKGNRGVINIITYCLLGFYVRNDAYKFWLLFFTWENKRNPFIYCEMEDFNGDEHRCKIQCDECKDDILNENYD